MAEIIERLNAALEGRYRVEKELGEGGMATVYLARDLRHDRNVAVKVLRPELAAVVGAERFLAEIKTTAALQHPHILPLHDSGEADSFLYYVMPYVEGESLRDRLERDRQLPVDEAVAIARKVADALQYAHEEGIIHRDVKPANILLSRGQPLVADFGIALAVSQAGGGRITETGLSLGTPHYMSPEQAAGERGLDVRTDVYALGCILYEMLAGQPPYGGPTAQSVLAQILIERPRRVTDFRPTVPPHVASVVARSLEKLPADRFETAEAFAKALSDPGFTYETRDATMVARPALVSAAEEATPPGPTRVGRLARGGLLAVLAGLAAWGWLRPSAAPGPVTTVRMAIPDSQAPVPRPSPRMALSPDGQGLVYVGPGGALWYRDLAQLDARPLRGTEEAYTPIFSPDGRSVAYTTGFPGDLKVVGLDGSAPVTVLRGTAYAYGMSWADDGWIYTTNDDGVLRVRAQGGALDSVVSPDRDRDETWRGWPYALPGGRYLLFQAWKGSAEDAEVGIRDLPTGKESILAAGLYPLYAATGHLIFVRVDGTVMAAPLDLDDLTLAAEPAALFGGVSVDLTNAYADLALSAAGTMVYQGGTRESQTLVWVGRDGSATPVDTSFTGDFSGISLSPDGRRVAAGVTVQGTQSIYVKELAGGPWRRVTFDSGRSDRPVWRPGADELSYLSNRGQSGTASVDIWTTRSDGTGSPLLTLDADEVIQEVEWSPDGRWLVYRVGPGGENRRDLFAAGDGGQGDTVALAATRFDEHSPRISPDGRWLAYVSDESGRPDVFVRPFPDVSGGKWQVSTAGGTEPVWAHHRSEIYYRAAGSGTMMAARYVTEPSFAVVDRGELFSAAPFVADPVHQDYDVSPDDQHFLMARSGGRQGSLVLVRNWFRQIEERLGETKHP